MVVCKCFFIDGRDIDITIDRGASGLDLFNSVCKFLNIEDKNPFGLVHRDGSKPSTYNWWVRLDKPLRKQIKGKCQVWVFALMVKFYPKENIEKSEEILRYYSLLQVRDDLLTGRLPCPNKNTLATLAAYWAQSEFGQFTFRSLDQQLAEAFNFVRPEEPSTDGKAQANVDESFLDKMVEIHKKLRDMSSIDADIKFLKLASTLPMYGTHYYPAFEWVFASHNIFTKRHPEFTSPVTMGLGFNGIYVHQEKKNGPRHIIWSSIHAIAFKKNLLLLKLHKNTKTKEQSHIYFAFENLRQAKTVWRAAIEIHVHCRVEKKVEQVVSVKLKRRWSFGGQQQATSVKAMTTPRLRLPRLATIAETLPASGLQTSEPHTHFAKDISSSNIKQKYSALFPLKTARSSTPRSTVSQRPVSSAYIQQDFSPFIGDLRKAQPNMHSLSFSHLPNIDTAPKITVFDKDILSELPSSRKSKTRRTVSETSITGEEIFSVPSESFPYKERNVVQRAQSYTEENKSKAVHSWLEENAVTKQHDQRRRPRSAPSHRPHLRGRSCNDIYWDGKHKPAVSSKQHRSTKLKLRDFSPPPTINYEDEPIRRKPEKYQSADNFTRKDWTIRREPVYAFDPAARRFADMYRHEYLRNMTDGPQYGSYRRAKSMHALGSLNRRTNRSPSLDCQMSASSSTLSGHASSGGRRSCGSCDPFYNDGLFHRLSYLPQDSSLSRRILSESRLHTKPSRRNDYELFLRQSDENLDSARGLFKRGTTSTGQNISSYGDPFDSRDTFF